MYCIRWLGHSCPSRMDVLHSVARTLLSESDGCTHPSEARWRCGHRLRVDEYIAPSRTGVSDPPNAVSDPPKRWEDALAVTPRRFSAGDTTTIRRASPPA